MGARSTSRRRILSRREITGEKGRFCLYFGATLHAEHPSTGHPFTLAALIESELASHSAQPDCQITNLWRIPRFEFHPFISNNCHCSSGCICPPAICPFGRSFRPLMRRRRRRKREPPRQWSAGCDGRLLVRISAPTKTWLKFGPSIKRKKGSESGPGRDTCAPVRAQPPRAKLTDEMGNRPEKKGDAEVNNNNQHPAGDATHLGRA